MEAGYYAITRVGSKVGIGASGAVEVFGHECSLLRTQSNGSGAAAISSVRDEPHLYLQNVLQLHVSDLAALAAWSRRIASVPTELISETCASAARMNICTIAEAQAVEHFLEYRKERVMSFLEAGRAFLPKVTGWVVEP